MAALKDNDNGFTAEQLAEALELLNDQDYQKRASGCNMLAYAGEKGVEHFEKLLEVMRGDDHMVVKREAANAVAALGKENSEQKELAISAMVEVLISKDPGMRAVGASGLGLLEAESAVDKLGELLADTHLTVRTSALVALCGMDEKSASQAKAIASRLDEPMLRENALIALGKLGKEGAAYEEEIVGFLLDNDLNIRCAVAGCFGDMAEHVSDHIVEEIASEMLTHINGRFRATAALALGCLGVAKAGKHADAIAKLLSYNNVSSKFEPGLPPPCAAAIALGKLGARGPELAALCQHANSQLRASACEGVGELGEEGAKFQRELFRCLKDGDYEVQGAAFDALYKIKEKASLDDDVLEKLEAMRLEEQEYQEEDDEAAEGEATEEQGEALQDE